MKFFNSFRQQLYRFFTKEHRDESLQMQPMLNKRAMGLMKDYGGKPNPVQGVEFFFYSDEEAKANNLAIELNKLGYTVYDVHPPEQEGKNWSIIGCIPPVPMGGNKFDKWTEQMIQLGYECDCQFDGWGTLIE